MASIMTVRVLILSFQFTKLIQLDCAASNAFMNQLLKQGCAPELELYKFFSTIQSKVSQYYIDSWINTVTQKQLQSQKEPEK